jgi:hypothetical protein
MHTPETPKQPQQQPAPTSGTRDKAKPPPVERPRGDAAQGPKTQRRDG